MDSAFRVDDPDRIGGDFRRPSALGFTPRYRARTGLCSAGVSEGIDEAAVDATPSAELTRRQPHLCVFDDDTVYGGALRTDGTGDEPLANDGDLGFFHLCNDYPRGRVLKKRHSASSC